MKNEEKIIKKLLEHNDQLDFIKKNMATREELGEIKTSLDKVLEISIRLDQERVATYQWIKRIETDVERQKIEIKRIKLKLKVA